MKALQTLDLSRIRLLRPGTWGAVALFGALWNGLNWLIWPVAPEAAGFVLPFALGALVLGLGAAPWQWSGDDRPLAPVLRGVIQALAWNALVLVLLAGLLPAQGFRGGMGRGMGMGMGMACRPFLGPGSARLLILVVAGAFGLLAGWILADRDKEALRADAQGRMAREAQARALQAQMNPHVLFNTLSGLAELAREDGPATEEALVSLAALLRRLLDHSGRVAVSLDEERGLVEGFLALERFRLGDRLTVRWTWDEGLEDVEVPPLLLQPLVENALKHGIGPSRDGGELEIGLAGDRAHLRLWVANTGRPLEAAGAPGTGLANLRQRLELMDGRRGRLALRSEGARTVAEVFLEEGHD